MRPSKQPRIFLSYRREDSHDITARIYDRLTKGFGRDRVYRDRESTPGGVVFPEYLVESMDGCDLLVVVIGPHWILPGDTESDSRSGPSAFSAMEVQRAIDRGIPILPILVNGAAVPLKSQLPDELHPLVERQALRVDGGEDFEHHIDRVIRAISDLHAGHRGTSTTARFRGPAGMPARLMIAAAVAAALAAVAFGLDGLNGSRGVSDPIRQAEASPAAESTAQAESALGWIVRLRYPSSWSELSADDHVAIRDPASGGVFLAGIDALDGPNSSADRFVARWAGTTAASYGVVRVTDATPQQSGSTLYSLEAALEADASRDAMVLVTAYSESEQTLFRWWAALGITEENAPTMRGIAESVEARETSDALSQQER